MVGIDWAEGHHDFAIHDEAGTTIKLGRISTGPAGLTELLEAIAGCDGCPEQTPIAIGDRQESARRSAVGCWVRGVRDQPAGGSTLP